jgi:hypothetical protein
LPLGARPSLRNENLARSTNQGIKPFCTVFLSRARKVTPLGFMWLPAIPTLVSSQRERASEVFDFLCLSSFSLWEKAGDEGRNAQFYLTFSPKDVVAHCKVLYHA